MACENTCQGNLIHWLAWSYSPFQLQQVHYLGYWLQKLNPDVKSAHKKATMKQTDQRSFLPFYNSQWSNKNSFNEFPML
jgi:hypothetical protein